MKLRYPWNFLISCRTPRVSRRPPGRSPPPATHGFQQRVVKLHRQIHLVGEHLPKLRAALDVGRGERSVGAVRIRWSAVRPSGPPRPPLVRAHRHGEQCHAPARDGHGNHNDLRHPPLLRAARGRVVFDSQVLVVLRVAAGVSPPRPSWAARCLKLTSSAIFASPYLRRVASH